MRPAAALVYLASVARVAAIQHGFPTVKSASSFIDVNPVSVADGSPEQFEKKLKLANLTSDRRVDLGTSLDVLFGRGRCPLDFE